MGKELEKYRKALRAMKPGDPMPRIELPEPGWGMNRRHITIRHPSVGSLDEPDEKTERQIDVEPEI